MARAALIATRWTMRSAGRSTRRCNRDAAFLSGANRNIESRYWDPVFLRNGRREGLTGQVRSRRVAEFAIDFVRRHRERPRSSSTSPWCSRTGQNFVEHTVTTPDNRDRASAGREVQIRRHVALRGQAGGRFRPAARNTRPARQHHRFRRVSDNGTERTDLGARATAASCRAASMTLTEAGGDVAADGELPAHIKGGRTVALADFSDVFPTICDLTRTPSPEGVQARRPFLRAIPPGRAARRRGRGSSTNYGADARGARRALQALHRGDCLTLDADPDEKAPISIPPMPPRRCQRETPAARSIRCLR